MRQADINRAKRAEEHLHAARTLLSNIKWENVSNLEYHFIQDCKDYIQSADFCLTDLFNSQS